MDWLMLLSMLIIPAIAQVAVSINYNKYKQIENDEDISGVEVARKILDANGLDDVHVVATRGNLTDHYDPRRKVVRLSTEIYHGKTIASLAVAAHECGHAIQDKNSYVLMRIRSFIYPIVNAATSVSYYIIFLGLLFESLKMIWLGIALVGFGLIFQLVTLPVEINASKRAGKQIDELHLANKGEQDGVKSMLTAAASTYLAGVLSSALELFRLFMLFGRRNER